MLKLLAAEVRPFTSPALSNPPKETVAPVLQWTGNAIDLVEMIYGINEMGCINGGEMPLKACANSIFFFRSGGKGLLPLLYGYKAEEE